MKAQETTCGAVLTEAQIDAIKQHYYGIGIMEGSGKVRFMDFLYGMLVGVCAGVSIVCLLK